MNDLTRFRLCVKHNIPPAAKLLYCYLLDLAGGRHNRVAVSVGKLAKCVGLSRSATNRNLNRLKRLGMISFVPRYFEDGGRLPNQYLLK